jgi:hypothetical protein
VSAELINLSQRILAAILKYFSSRFSILRRNLFRAARIPSFHFGSRAIKETKSLFVIQKGTDAADGWMRRRERVARTLFKRPRSKKIKSFDHKNFE